MKEELSATEIQSELGRVLQSRPFLRSRQLQRMLRFIVEESLAGRGEEIKEYLLGVEVFDRPSSYDPRLDSLVRVEARRLRSALDSYYGDEGRSDPLVIEIAKGSYVPTFRRRAEIPPGVHRPQPRLRARWRWIAGSAAALLLAAAASRLPFFRAPGGQLSRATIVILPFDNLSNDPENEYFCFGLTDEITTGLAKTGQLRVVARTSAASFRRGDDIAKIARKLKADVVLEGSVRSSAGRVLVTAQLINAADQIHLWSEMYERPSVDLLNVQNDIALAVTNAVRLHLGSSARDEAPKVHYSNYPEANELYWRGAYLRVPMGTSYWRNALLKSADCFEQAVRKDDHFAPAYASLADVYVSLAWERGGNPITADLMARGRRAAMRALELDDSLAEASGALGTIQFFYDYDPVAAEKSFHQALNSDPSNAKARMWYAYALVMQRRFDEAISQARQARELDPLSYVATTHLAVVDYFSGRYDEAMTLVGETLQVADTAPAHGLRGMILAAQRKYGEAIAEYQSGLALVPTHSYIKGMLGHAYGMSGQAQKARELLKDSRLEFEKGGLSDLKVAYIYLALGDRDEAIRHLKLDFDKRDPELPYVNADPVFDPVRNDPRFIALLKRMGLSR
jgi:TolB-like protein/Flp pilus assembly protein TadD